MAEDDRPFTRPDEPWPHTHGPVEPEPADQPEQDTDQIPDAEEPEVAQEASGAPWGELGFVVFPQQEVLRLLRQVVEHGERHQQTFVAFVAAINSHIAKDKVDICMLSTALEKYGAAQERTAGAQERAAAAAERAAAAAERAVTAQQSIAAGFQKALEIATSE